MKLLFVLLFLTMSQPGWALTLTSDQITDIILDHDDKGQMTVGDDGEECLTRIDLKKITQTEQDTLIVYYHAHHKHHWACYYEGLFCHGHLKLSSLSFTTLSCGTSW